MEILKTMLLLLLQNNELIKLSGITFLDMLLKVREVRQLDTTFNERRNITKSSFGRYVEISKDNLYSPNYFDLLNCETAGKKRELSTL